MKNINTYIKEELNKYRLNSIDVVYNILPSPFYITAPETFQESDIYQYLYDMVCPSLPASLGISEEYFGKNADNIFDVYIKWNSFEHLQNVNKDEYTINLEFDPKYNDYEKSSNIKLDIFRMSGMVYVIKFDRFDILNGTDDNVKDALIEIFKAAESNSINDDYPVTIKLNTEKLVYRK